MRVSCSLLCKPLSRALNQPFRMLSDLHLAWGQLRCKASETLLVMCSEPGLVGRLDNPCGCAGASFLPYLITDRVVAPEGCRKCYSEHLARMPNCYFVNDYKRAHMVRPLEDGRPAVHCLSACTP